MPDLPPAPLTWPRLRPGDTVRVVSPASFPSAEEVAELQRVLESWGLRVELGDHVLDQRGFMAGRDLDRLADLDDALGAPHVRAVIASRGGAGAYRIAHAVAVDAVRRDPKPVVGFSDITHLHLALWAGCGLVGLHGAAYGLDGVRSLRTLLMDDAPVVVERDPGAYSAQIQVPGHAEGPLVGGNLSALAHEVGAGLPSLAGTILLLEDFRGMGLGRVDRQLTQLRRSGVLDGVLGIALGLVTGFEDHEDRGWTLLDVLHDHLDDLGVPVLGGLPIGHGGIGTDGAPDQTCVAVGAPAVLDTTAGTLTSTVPPADVRLDR